MKKIILALLLAISTQAFAQKNELVLSPGILYYHTQTTFSKTKTQRAPIEGYGQMIAVHHMHNIKGLQIGGGFELGKFNNLEAETNPPNSVPFTYSMARPYFTGDILANYRLRMNKWMFYGGGCAGYMTKTAWKAGSNDIKIKTKGFYKGGQLGASYQLQSKLAVSADLTARFAKLEHPDDPDHNISAHYNRLRMYNFGIGVHYTF